MAYVCIVVSLPSETIAQINAQVVHPTNLHEEIESLITVLRALDGGMKRSNNAYAVVRDTDPSVSTSGSGSTSTSFNKP